MQVRVLLPFAAVLGLILLPRGSSAGPAPVQPVSGEILAAHNQLRAKVGAPDLKWSEALASSAQAWAKELEGKGCKLEPSHASHGENLYWAGPVTWSDGRTEAAQVSGAQVVANWAEQASHYDAAKNECVGGECLGYTQMVWSDTTDVGCGVAVCADHAQVWVCQYDPPGNVQGQRPYPQP